MITPNDINPKQGFRYSFKDTNITIESTACEPKSLPAIGGYTLPTTFDTRDTIVASCYVDIVTKNAPKKIRRAGGFRCGGGLPTPTNIEPSSAPWSGPSPGSDYPVFKLTPEPKENDAKSLDSSEVYAEVLNKYINNEGIPPYATLTYKNIDGQTVTCSNPSQDFFNCFGYALGTQPDQTLQNRLKTKTGNDGSVIPHRLKIECSINFPECRAKLDGPIQMRKFRCENLSPTRKASLKTQFLGGYSKYPLAAAAGR
jgi:hypothetical protein